MYGTLAISHRALDDLTDAAGDDAIDELRSLARPLEGLRVLNLSVTAFGTGTAELLNSSVPLLTDLGLDCHWQVVRAPADTLPVTRAMYQAMAGTNVTWTSEMTDRWLRYAEMNAALLTEPFDIVIVHDPQPAAIRSYVEDLPDTRWLFHSHLDLSSAQEDVWLLVRRHIERYDGAIFESPSFARADLNVPTYIVPPAIDPTGPRNMPLPDDVVRTMLERHGVDPERPIVCQVSPCDAGSDLLGAVDAFSAARERVPGLQFVLLLTTEPGDPSARGCYDELARRSADDRGITVLSMGNEVGNVELNVFQRAADVVIQRGLRKGFGMWVSDAMWKQRPVVACPQAGLQEQVVDGKTGVIAETQEQFADAIVDLLSDPGRARQLGAAGRSRVQERFMITRYLRDYLQILGETHRSA